MTRFARAKGSKSSNERAPENSTPWEVMKEQMLLAKKQSEESKKREEVEKQRIENYENFLKEHKSQKRKATWCDFPDTENLKHKVYEESVPSSKKKNKQKLRLESNQFSQANSVSTGDVDKIKTACKKSKKKKHTQNSEEILSSVCEDVIETADSLSKVTSIDNGNNDYGKKKKKKQKKPAPEVVSETKQSENGQEIKPNTKKNKTNRKLKVISEDQPICTENENDIGSKQNVQNKESNKIISKNKKLVNGVPVRRKPIDDRSFQLIINGKEVELVRFDGFPIMKRDAERLDELRKNMINKGIPKSEVNRTLKLERRRAEKALARLKRDVCYNCRKGGHNLSDCPELKTKIPGVGAPDGVCFKCGSTEHRQFECKVQKDKEFRFATCFICKEPGHIARQCPDNPKGLYPNGGGCKLCGDVTHLRKDCPTATSSKEETSIKLQTLESSDNLESIGQNINTTPQEKTKKPKKIKF